jgi:predicted O-methyltransferase YrrM
VYTFHQSVLRGNASEVGKEIEGLRRKLSQDQRLIRRQDFGAGSAAKGGGQSEVKLGSLARRASRRRKEGEFLYRLCQFYQPQRCLELGTHLGISALYQLSALPAETEFISLEGDPALSALAQAHLSQFGLSADLRIGEFSTLLAQLNLPDWRPDYVLIDGNHRYAPTMAYFQLLLPTLADGAMLLFDDIHWSAEMEQAWAEIIVHPEVSVSIDLFQFGLCFVRRPQAKEHVCLRW